MLQKPGHMHHNVMYSLPEELIPQGPYIDRHWVFYIVKREGNITAKLHLSQPQVQFWVTVYGVFFSVLRGLATTTSTILSHCFTTHLSLWRSLATTTSTILSHCLRRISVLGGLATTTSTILSHCFTTHFSFWRSLATTTSKIWFTVLRRISVLGESWPQPQVQFWVTVLRRISVFGEVWGENEVEWNGKAEIR